MAEKCPTCNCEVDGVTNKREGRGCERCICARHGMRKDGHGGCAGCANDRKKPDRKRP